MRAIIYTFLFLALIQSVFSFDITYNSYLQMGQIYYYNASGGRFNLLGSTTSGADDKIDYFPNNAVVNDALVIATGTSSYQFGKYNGLNFNVSTALVADQIGITWEYASNNGTGNGMGIFAWTPLENVTDNCNNFTTLGSCNVTWNTPLNWTNYNILTYNVSSSDNYRFFIRARIDSVTSITEGGKQGNSVISGISRTFSLSCNPYEIINISVINDFDDTQANVITELGQSYIIDANILLNSNCAWECRNENVQFNTNYMFYNNGYIRFGDIIKGKTYNGCNVMFISYKADYSTTYIMNNGINDSYSYNSKFVVYDTTSGVGNGIWGGGLGVRNNTAIVGSYFQGWRQVSFSYDNNVIGGIDIYDTGVETPGATLYALSLYGSASFRLGSTNKYDYVLDSDLDLTSATYSINPYGVGENFTMSFADCNWGTTRNISRIVYWSTPKTNQTIYKKYSLLYHAIDSTGNPIFNATLNITNRLNESYFFQSNEDGYFYFEAGNVTSATSNKITDNTKSWNNNEFRFYKFLITSGKGVGQQRISHFGGEATTLIPHLPFEITPNETSKYIVLPYINAGIYTPISATGATAYSNYTDLNPFTLTFSKQGYKSVSFPQTITKAVDDTVIMEELPTWNASAPLYMKWRYNGTDLLRINTNGDLWINGLLYEDQTASNPYELIWGGLYLKGLRRY